ncbi:CsbD family protein [Paenibacillus mucilaginosus]|uniref:CsbD family protein n=3 Tax=Paenibacillus mucilaginosus TaxID=61624 RepID=H6NA10_9BACL|nr:CsbD family protein [Paenibacillus mucilaginosus]AEI40209.1 CsbD family protein [Paenibacillus mucilaginosus KNP414]AFC28854.1 CsbD family protein [Paenibacillus mucilaginosus 3016]AFH61030.1 hypothetical protein B2K_09890 [Paenibacillus mucilaginosus K02]MCG7213421.1 CsbD family protein [Paenibacillus mucilaginosus]WDM29435.1 CsbD family protein [Paenibacillus mucilaginosus]
METTVLKGKWNQIKGEVKKQWGELTDDDLEQISGEKDRLIGILQERYGHAREDIEREYKEWSIRWTDSDPLR